MMTSPTGNSFPINKMIRAKRAFTLVEVLVTLVILGGGIVIIFKTYLTSLDQLNYLTSRLYATIILDNNITSLQRALRTNHALNMDLNHSASVEVGGKKIAFDQDVKVSAQSELDRLFQADLTLGWREGRKNVQLRRSAYIFDRGDTN